MEKIYNLIQVLHATVFTALAILIVAYDHSSFLTILFSQFIDVSDVIMMLVTPFIALSILMLPILYKILKMAGRTKITMFISGINILGLAVLLYGFVFGILLT